MIWHEMIQGIERKQEENKARGESITARLRLSLSLLPDPVINQRGGLSLSPPLNFFSLFFFITTVSITPNKLKGFCGSFQGKRHIIFFSKNNNYKLIWPPVNTLFLTKTVTIL